MKKFYLGMDIGTESVGMACTDENYDLLRAKGKDLWAVRLFDEANDAKERRTKRAARRRLQRRRQRIEWLQDVFAPFMKDELFFLRLNNSGFYKEDKDKRLVSKFSLFNDVGYTDKEFYKEYPTIFHLREKLLKEPDAKIDLRHYYLALHHIVKYRGHFLFEGENMGDVRDIKKLFKNYNDLISEYGIELDLCLSEAKAEAFKTLALYGKGKNDKKKEGILLFGATSVEKKEWIALLLGSTVSPKKMFGEDYQERYKEEKAFSFDGLTDEAFEAMQENYEEEHFALLQAARSIYNFTVFERVLEGSSCISEAMVAIYKKHKEDLKLLKDFVKENYTQEVYYKIFRSRKETANYVNYIGYNQSKGIKSSVSKCKEENFYKFLVKVLKSETVVYKEKLGKIIKELDEKTFLPKILHADNGLFPHQINEMELNMILENLCKQYPEFVQIGDDGYSPKQKIEKIFKFKIPYYVGPLNTASANAWMKRNDGLAEKITPWNFDSIVDRAGSNEEFIRRMTNKCTYLRGKDVLPKCSMYYQAFDVLNQINKLTIEGAPISLSLKQEIFQNVYLFNKKVTAKQIREYLVKQGYCTQEESSNVLGGFDNLADLKASMSSYVGFKTKFGSLVDSNPEMFENIILWHTLNSDKTIVEEIVLREYGNISAIRENIKWLKSLTSFKEFGRLSKELLLDIVGGVDQATGEIYTILNRLYNTNYNFNQLLFADEYNFRKEIEENNGGVNKEEITYDDVRELYVSPMVRRGVWQALQMTKEYVHAVGKTPNKIFIEVTRQDGEKGERGRKASRKNKLMELYKEIGSDCRDIEELTKELTHQDITDSRLRSERLYLYFLQLGKCVYTGNRINLEELMGNRYDVDHIIPQSMTKDDSVDNKVLVERQKNAEKTNQYPLPEGFTTQQNFWKLLKVKGLMSESKFNRLARVKPLSDDDFREFINRQLVVTNQTVKAVAELLKQKYEPLGTKIVYSKAKNVDDFKQRHGIVKCRETNDLHHARDAYLNIVVGNIYDTKFTSKYAYRYTDKEGTSREYNLDNLYRWKIDGAWNGASDIVRVKKIVARTSMCVTRYAYTNQGAFYDETIYNKDDGAIALPRKMSMPYVQTEKYGGFKSLKTAYFAIVQSKDKKGCLIKTIEAIPVLVDYQARQDACAVIRYLQRKGLVEPKLIVQKLKMKSLVAINGYNAWLAGVTGNRILIHNAVQWFTKPEVDNYIKQLLKYIERDKEGKLSISEKESDSISLTQNRQKVSLYATKEENLKIYNGIISKLNQKPYQGLSSVRAFSKKLQEKARLFKDITTFEQIKVLLQIVRFMKCNAECSDLSLLKDGTTCGKLLIGKNITNVDFSIIHQSPCGLVERIQKV
ncbi:MAG: type II CRISPR RNA-guided endonuclease Cas9 [Clostridiales bacterium]|nr:type II CRISPR RNA-guided endonuclease Cas9 [Clostridiales bacterium]